MSIVVKNPNTEQAVPPDYVKCTKQEAIQHQLAVIQEWHPRSDVWPFIQGPLVLSAMGAVSGAIITGIIRRKLKLGHYGRMAMLLPAIGVPGSFGPVLHHSLVTEPLVVQSECPVCLQMRAVLIQNAMGIGYPIVISSATGLFLAEKYATYRLPEFTWRGVPDFIRIARGIINPYTNRMLALAVVSSLVALFITDRQANSLFTIAQKIHDDGDLTS